MIPHGAYKEVSIGPLSHQLDNKSTPDEQRPNNPRVRQNFYCDKHGRVGRLYGWSKLLDTVTYNNQDLHDQLLALQHRYGDTSPPTEFPERVQTYPSDECGPNISTLDKGREQVTFLFEALATNGSRTLLAGTQSRLYELNEATGNWRLIGDGLGGDSRSDSYIRWQAAQIRDTIILSNGVDIVFYELGAGHSGCDMQAVKKVPDLDRLNISAAKAIASYKNMVFLGCTFEDGGWVENRIRWSNATVDRDAMLDWEELGGAQNVAEGSVADYQDLDYGHKILRIVPLKDWLMVYTNLGVYRANLTGGTDPIIAFEKIYENRAGDGCVAFPFTLVSTGNEHWWIGRDGIYKMDAFSPQPEFVEWANSATGDMFSDINRSDCNGQVGGYDPRVQSIWFSWSRDGQWTPSASLLISPKNTFVSTVDHGFTVFGTYRSDERLSYRDFLREICVCSDFNFDELFVKEGLPFAATCTQEASYLYTDRLLNFDDEIEVEDYWHPEPSTGSLCTILRGLKPEDFCRECNEDQLFIAVSGDDWCIKQMDLDTFSREMCVNGSDVGTTDADGYHSSIGRYGSVGYLSRIVFGPLAFGDTELKKNLSYLSCFAVVRPLDATDPHVAMRVGASYYPQDPESQDCEVVWSKPQVRQMKCPLRMSADAYRDNKLSPSNGIEAPFYVTGRFLYLDIRIGQKSSDGSDVVAGVGGESYHSRLSMNVRKAGY